MDIKENKANYISQILSASLTLMGILIGVLGVLVSQYSSVIDIDFIAAEFRFLIISTTFLVLLSGLISFLSLLNLRGFKIPTKLVYYLLGFLIIFVTVGIPIWAVFTIY